MSSSNWIEPEKGKVNEGYEKKKRKTYRFDYGKGNLCFCLHTFLTITNGNFCEEVTVLVEKAVRKTETDEQTRQQTQKSKR